jgi:threonine/homoserine/homoserine lactone efflux protein
MDLTSLAVFAGILLLAAGTPGPNIGALVARVISRGHKGVFPFMLGLWIGDAVWLSLAVWGLSTLAHNFHTVFLVLKYGGLLYLAYLAWKMWFAPVSDLINEEIIPRRNEAGGLFLSALAITLGNPKIMVFYVAILPTVIDLTGVSILGWGELLLVMFAVLAVVYNAWVLLAVQARRFLRTPRMVKIANRTCAGMMAGVAVAIATR